MAATAVVLCHASADPARVKGAGERWLPLMRDYAQLVSWESSLGREGRIAPGPSVSAAAARLRRPFLDATAALGQRHDSTEWWASRVSERNPMVSPLFLHCCWLSVGVEALEQQERTLTVVCDAPEVLASLELEAKTRGIPCRSLGRSRSGARPIGRALEVLGFLARALKHRVRAPSRLEPLPRGRPLALIRTWIDESCFGEDGEFRDRYFPGVAAQLERDGFVALTVPVPFNLKRSYRDAWRWLDSARSRFLAPESHLRLIDSLWALRAAFRASRLPRGRVCIEGQDVTELFEADRRRFFLDPGTLQALLSYRLPLRLAQHGVHPALVIETYENLMTEKQLIRGVRDAFPGARVVGFQHGSLPPMLLSHYVTETEARFAPLPDRVVCSGHFFRDVLVREGLPAERVVVGPALRFSHLFRATAQPQRAEAREVLVTLPLEADAAAELLAKVSEAFGERGDVRVRLKPHPMMSAAELSRLSSAHSVPEHFGRAEGPIGEWLAQCDVVVALASSTIYEALAAGVPVVVVGRETGLDLNPLGWHPELAGVVYEPEAVAAEAERLLSLSAAERQRQRQLGSRLLEQSFEPVSERTMRVFHEGLLDG